MAAKAFRIPSDSPTRPNRPRAARRASRCDFDLSEDPPDCGEELLVRERLLQVFLGAELDRLDGALDRRVAGDHHDLGVRETTSHEPDELEAVDFRHPEIRENEVERAARPEAPSPVAPRSR